MGSTFKTLFAAVFATWPLAAQAQTIEGNAQVLAGNAIDLAGTVIALRGIDAPAANQSCSKGGQNWSCGKDAQALLAQIVSRGGVRCEALARRDGDTFAGVCRAGDLDLGEVMVGSGLALAVADGGPDYSAEETRAKSLKLGVWGGEFEAPSAWRAAHPQAAPPAKRAQATVLAAQTVAEQRPAPRVYRNAFGCAIKGNHSRHGDWIYHLPGTRYYEQTRPEALFCTEEEAVAAGYRRSKAD